MNKFYLSALVGLLIAAAPLAVSAVSAQTTIAQAPTSNYSLIKYPCDPVVGLSNPCTTQASSVGGYVNSDHLPCLIESGRLDAPLRNCGAVHATSTDKIITLNASDANKTIRINVYTPFTVDFGSGRKWSVKFTPSTLVTKTSLGHATGPVGVTTTPGTGTPFFGKLYQATGVGTAKLTATGMPICTSGYACTGAIELITINLDFYRTSPPPLPPAEVILNLNDANKTIRMEVGTHFTVNLGSGLQWSVSFAPTTLIVSIPSKAASQIGNVYESTGVGTVKLTAMGTPICKIGYACPQSIRIIKMTLDIYRAPFVLGPTHGPVITIAQIQAKIAVLVKQIAVLTAEITQIREGKTLYSNVVTTSTNPNTAHRNTGINIKNKIQRLLSRQLIIGSTGGDVVMLQRMLSTDPSIYPSRLVTGYYGHLTEEAVRIFQRQHNISDIGEVGPKTRSALNTYFETSTGLPSSLSPSNVLNDLGI